MQTIRLPHAAGTGPALRRSTLAAAALLAFGPAWAADEDDEAARLARPEATVRAGLSVQSKDSLRLGQYSGRTDRGGTLELDLDLVKRDDATGTWLRVTGRDLGLDSREVSAEHERQGDWRYFIEYNQIPRHEPLRITTGLSGIGTANQAINGSALREVELGTERKRTTLGYDKSLGNGLAVQLRLRHEDKEGSRVFGRNGALFLAEPIDSRTQQIDATLSYTGQALQLTGGYYGSGYTNRLSAINVSNVPGTPPTTATVALAPDNESHQFHIGGGYSLSPSTRATFKLAQGTTKQNERFFTAPDFPGNTQTDLGGRVDTTLAQLGLSSRPLPALSLRANLRHEERDDKTPRFPFIDGSLSRDGYNTPFSRRSSVANLEASYALPDAWRLTGGVDHERRQRSTLTIRQASWREKNDETGLRLELRRSLSETVNGAVSYVHSERDGADYLPANNNAAADFIDPVHFADRKRDKLRLTLDWTPAEAWSLQLQADAARDRYDGRPLGPERGTARFWSLDSTYALNDDWQAVGWLASDDTRVRQSTNTGANATQIAAQTWQARLRSAGTALGLGLRGKVAGDIEVGTDLQLQRDRNEDHLVAAMPPEARLPDITTRHTTLKLFGRMPLQRDLTLQVDLVHDRYRSNDWTWTDWVYADGSTVAPELRSQVSVIGVSVVYRLW